MVGHSRRCSFVCDELTFTVFVSVAEEPVTGVPEFWLTIFKNVDLLADLVQEHDEPILKHLEDIQLELHRSDPMVRPQSKSPHLLFCYSVISEVCCVT